MSSMAMYCASLAKLIFEAGHELLESRNEGFSLARLSFCAPCLRVRRIYHF